MLEPKVRNFTTLESLAHITHYVVLPPPPEFDDQKWSKLLDIVKQNTGPGCQICLPNFFDDCFKLERYLPIKEYLLDSSNDLASLKTLPLNDDSTFSSQALCPILMSIEQLRLPPLPSADERFMESVCLYFEPEYPATAELIRAYKEWAMAAGNIKQI